MLNITKNFIKVNFNRMFKSYKKPSLGRWGLTGDLGEDKCSLKEELIIKQANMDNCGDELCGIPKFDPVKKI
tara:strand:+ start:7035 stop:7250 length:216 start_codon:yes stop_codon:yes gene_type:complete